MHIHRTDLKPFDKDAIGLKGANGKAFVKEYYELAKTKSSGWAGYM